jgi:hypothetical protein
LQSGSREGVRCRWDARNREWTVLPASGEHAHVPLLTTSSLCSSHVTPSFVGLNLNRSPDLTVSSIWLDSCLFSFFKRFETISVMKSRSSINCIIIIIFKLYIFYFTFI